MPPSKTVFRPDQLQFLQRVLDASMSHDAARPDREGAAAKLIQLYSSGLTDEALLKDALSKRGAESTGSADVYFDLPVHVELGGVGKVRVITSVREALDCLQNRWPCRAGQNALSAQRACAAALDGQKEPRQARKAFEKAAMEADALVGPFRGHGDY